MPSLLLLTGAPDVHTINTSAGMLFACWAIVIVLLAMALVFMRAGQKAYALAILPLVITPFVHIFSGVIARTVSPALPFTAAEVRAALDMTSGLVSCLLIGATTRGITRRKTRNALSISCSGFIIILTLVLVMNTLTAGPL
ncbi:MAG: hypothetical protein HFJ79_01265 [Clostridiales bacterium]|jgi:hypothetical protein|nr:hypothetical protein [Clostridiales bacterium]